MDKLETEVYNRYIAPLKRKRNSYVGIEFELPVVNLHNEPVDFSVCHSLTDAFVKHFSFSSHSLDEDGEIYLSINETNGDSISFDCSYNTLELSFGVEQDMNVLYNRFATYYQYIQNFLLSHHHTLTGMGINPHYHLNHDTSIPSQRYRMLFHHLSSYPAYSTQMEFHNTPNFGLFSCANQVQLDVEENQLVEVINTTNRLEPVKALLFSNSPWKIHGKQFACGRDYLWKNSLHGLNPHNVDMHLNAFSSIDEIVKYIADMSLYCVIRDGKYINFKPTPLSEYFSSKQITGEYFNGTQYENITFEPEWEDLSYLRSFKFEDITFRGTVEFRSACEQPVSEIMTVAAFQAGLMENLHELTDLLSNDTALYQKGFSPDQLRVLCNQESLPDIFSKKEVTNLLLKVITLAEDGLQKRGNKEEDFLKPLYRRAETFTNPGKDILNGLRNGQSIEHYIKSYSNL